MTTMDSLLPAPAAEAADSKPATDGPMGLAAVPCSAFVCVIFRRHAYLVNAINAECAASGSKLKNPVVDGIGL
jgi:hypothetical protein